jgi:acyl CoA:acetate/3-ketoacid CoA transferase beta subunit
MKRFINIRSLMITIVLLLGAIPAAAVERPFALSGTGVAVLFTDEAGKPISADVTGSGTATHLGSWTTAGTVRYSEDNGVMRSHAETTIIVANGDKLNVVIVGALDLNTVTDHGTFTFVGGTGRFQGASGSADFVVSINPLTGGFELTVVGRINY